VILTNAASTPSADVPDISPTTFMLLGLFALVVFIKRGYAN
jgi:hypothetical protein